MSPPNPSPQRSASPTPKPPPSSLITKTPSPTAFLHDTARSTTGISLGNSFTQPDREISSFRTYIPTNTLARHCSLDGHAAGQVISGNNLGPTPDLGTISILPIELQLGILNMLDVKSLLVVRRVNQRAMNTVSSMIEWKKIMAPAPNALRIAIGLRIHHTFTLKNLLDAISRSCCYNCGSETSALDMTNLQRSSLEYVKAILAEVDYKTTHQLPVCIALMRRVDALLDFVLKGMNEEFGRGDIVRLNLDGRVIDVEVPPMDPRTRGIWSDL
ncbi:hypothetical protein CC86DRAFT_470746 [Ophiobolus disseminans]|uniref:F-box domain-containing protein n=1 Tax=Ophiobolus disseminans TaxID=1469910 RepID=A0A6A6ZL01_9PLEO|nr:hypothetical protein CC86DRAFT_470746 [Ophiobolus disseminans]